MTDSGRAICPITTYCANQHGVYAKDVHGRVMPLDLIRKTHLLQMNSLGLLRNSEANSMTRQQCESTLRARKGNKY